MKKLGGASEYVHVVKFKNNSSFSQSGNSRSSEDMQPLVMPQRMGAAVP